MEPSESPSINEQIVPDEISQLFDELDNLDLNAGKVDAVEENKSSNDIKKEDDNAKAENPSVIKNESTSSNAISVETIKQMLYRNPKSSHQIPPQQLEIEKFVTSQLSSNQFTASPNGNLGAGNAVNSPGASVGGKSTRVYVCTKDNQKLRLPYSVLKQCRTLSAFIDTFVTYNSPCPLPIYARHIKVITEYAKHFNPAQSYAARQSTQLAYKDFGKTDSGKIILRLEIEDTLLLYAAADFLQYDRLMDDIVCSMMYRMSLDEDCRFKRDVSKRFFSPTIH